MVGFLIIITENRRFSRNDKAAITPYITPIAVEKASAVVVDSPSLEMFSICVLFIFLKACRRGKKYLTNNFAET